MTPKRVAVALERFDEKFGGRLGFHHPEELEDIKALLASEIEAVYAEVRGEIEDYFKGLLIILDPQATKENLLHRLEGKGETDTKV